MKKEIHEDQKKILIALSMPWEYWDVDENMGIRGVTVEQLIHGTGLSREKILLSMGWLEEEKTVAHDMGVERKVIDYFGHSNVTIPGTQLTVRLFYLTKKGKEVTQSIQD
ncbi:MAG: hypothetical protein ACC656_14125 [Candidatus Heimdallarchaeota archaeon]